MPKKPSRKNLIKKLDTVFSEYIRRKYADKNGIVKCYTCDKKAFWKGEGMQNGHFISRKSRILRWREDNCRPQCYTCNCHFYGRQYIFSVNLNKETMTDIPIKSSNIEEPLATQEQVYMINIDESNITTNK